jgi:hypothetical protein
MGPHVVVMRDGQSMTGEILNKQFKVTNELGTFAVKSSNVIHIIFAGASAWKTNEVLLKGASKLRGDLEPATLKFRLQDTNDTVEIAHKKIHIAIFLATIYGK